MSSKSQKTNTSGSAWKKRVMMSSLSQEVDEDDELPDKKGKGRGTQARTKAPPKINTDRSRHQGKSGEDESIVRSDHFEVERRFPIDVSLKVKLADTWLSGECYAVCAGLLLKNHSLNIGTS